ncbi:MAG: DUF1284 domain-containing protein, partial [Acetatifactor sp.]|nr:DUF1284 domain-containing protein [Acetatifactor sp.]
MKLRPHHSLCMQFFIGKGYSQEFTDKMYELLKLPQSTPIEITFGLDELCHSCPNHQTGVCDSEAHVHEIDRRVAEHFAYTEGSKLTLGEFWENAGKDIIEKKTLREYCGDCEFMG